jgi:YbbR domain-containing protein
MKSKVVRFLLSLVIALGIWLYVVSVVSPESEAVIHKVPVLLEGESTLAERDLIIVSGKNFNVDLKLFGNRVDLNKLTASNITVVADLSQITEPGEHNIRYDISYPSVVEYGNIEAIEKTPQYITLTVVERDWKEVPVKVEYGNTRVPEGYVVNRQNPQYDHATITVTGPKETLEHVNYAKIEVDLTGKTTTIVGSFQHILCDAKGNPLKENDTILYVDKLSTNISAIRATIEIYKIKEIPIEVEVIPGGGLTQDDVTLQQSLQTIVVTGSDIVLEKLDKIVVGQIRLAELMESGSITFDIVMPSGVSNVTGVTDMKVDVTLLRELAVKTLTISATQIRLENRPSDRHVKLVTQAITIKVRGTAEALANLDPADILVMVDCSDVAEMANMTVPMNVTIQIAGETGCGAVGTYQVIIEITQIGAGG